MRFARPLFFVLVFGFVGHVEAETVFDNLGGPHDGRGWCLDNPEEMAAQPFELGNNDTVTSVTLRMRRMGRPDGTVSLNLHDDDAGKPGALVGPLGSLDPLAVIGSNGRYPFDTPVSGLKPEETYHLVLSHDGTNLGRNNCVLWDLTSQRGAADAEMALAISPKLGVDDWHTTTNYPAGGPPFPTWFYASVVGSTALQAGDADLDLDFDQMDLVQIQVAAKYLTGQNATWGEGDWNEAPGGSQDSPPVGDGAFDQFDIIAAQQAGVYLSGAYAAIVPKGQANDGQTSIVYRADTGELAVDGPAGMELTSINIDSASGILTGEATANLGGSFDNDANENIFKATFGGSFGSLSFGNVAQAGLSEELILGDLTVVGSLAGGGDLGMVDLVYVPEPASVLLLAVGFVFGTMGFRRSGVCS